MMCGPVRDIPGGPVRKVVVAGGYEDNPINWGYRSYVEIYDVAGNIWTKGIINYLNQSLSEVLI